VIARLAHIDEIIVDEAVVTLQFFAVPIDATASYDLRGLDDLVVTRETHPRVARLRDTRVADRDVGPELDYAVPPP